jgi:4-amino-4-deoxy-L-arabinose transferase-like glycosyltransferase
VWTAVTLAFIAVLLLGRLAAFGVWDPWELRTADDARRWASQGPAAHERFSLGLWLVSAGFRLFGVHEWAGRLPIALAGLACVAASYALARRYLDSRGAVYAALIAGTTPLLLFNARTMLGAAPDMALSGLAGVMALGALVPASESDSTSPWAWLLACLALVLASTLTRGALLGVVPPLGAAVAAAWLDAPEQRARRLSRLALTAVWLALAFCVGRDVWRDASEYSVWIGGGASAGAPGTFDAVVEQVFHAFAPWSALLPIAMSRLWILDSSPSPSPSSSPTRALQSACLIWIAVAYGAQTLFVSRYGREATFLAVVPLAVLVAHALRDLEREDSGSNAAGIAVLLLVGLLLRDFATYPGGTMQGMPIANFEPPKVWNPRSALSAVLIPFGLCAALGLAAPRAARSLDWRAPYRFFGVQWRRGLRFRIWLIAAAGLLAAACIVGALAYITPRSFHVPSLALKLLKRLLYAPVALGGAWLLGQGIGFAFGWLGSRRFVPLLLAGAAWGVYAAQFYLPALSNHFSPRDVYTTYNQLAKPDEPLAELRISSRTAAYYAKGRIIEVSTVPQLVDHLTGSGQRWAAFPEDSLPDVDRAFRAATGRHLFLADARSAHALLAASQPVPQRKDENYLSQAVRTDPPEHLQHPVTVNFDERVELLGYELKLPHSTYVGAGESFTLTWYFRSLRKLTTTYRSFVHIDGEGQRIHGDHDFVAGKYAVTLWEPGDIVVDEQKIDVPASSHAGEYVIYMGFYSGDTRLPIKQGPNAGEDRARVGVLRIQ